MHDEGLTRVEVALLGAVAMLTLALMPLAHAGLMDVKHIADCMNNQKQIGLSILQFDMENGGVMMPTPTFAGDTAEKCARQLFMLYDGGRGYLTDPRLLACKLDRSTGPRAQWTPQTKRSDKGLQQGTSYNLTANFNGDERANMIILADQKSPQGAFSANHGDTMTPADRFGWNCLYYDGHAARHKVDNPDDDQDADGIYTGSGKSEGQDTFVFAD